MFLNRSNFEFEFLCTFPGSFCKYANHDLDRAEYPRLAHQFRHLFVRNFGSDNNAWQPK